MPAFWVKTKKKRQSPKQKALNLIIRLREGAAAATSRREATKCKLCVAGSFLQNAQKNTQKDAQLKLSDMLRKKPSLLFFFKKKKGSSEAATPRRHLSRFTPSLCLGGRRTSPARQALAGGPLSADQPRPRPGAGNRTHRGKVVTSRDFHTEGDNHRFSPVESTAGEAGPPFIDKAPPLPPLISPCHRHPVGERASERGTTTPVGEFPVRKDSLSLSAALERFRVWMTIR